MQSKSPQELTQARLKELLHYDPETGVFTWHNGKTAGGLSGHGYLKIQVRGRQYYLHRLAFLWVTGVWPAQEVDHINGVRDDNRWVNLREVGQLENQHNRAFAQRNNSCGFLGVSWNKKYLAWQSKIMVAGKRVWLGYHPTAEAAHAAYLKAKDELHPTHQRLRVAA